MIGTGPSARVRGDGRLLAASGSLGLLAGVAAKAADESGWSWAADLGTYPAAWVLAVAVIGRSAPSLGAAAARAAAFFAAMTVAYYAWAVLVLGFGYEPDLIATWLVLSVSAVAAFAGVTWWSTRRPGPLAGGLVALAGATALVGGAVRGLYLSATGSAVVVRPVQAAVEVVVVLVVVVALPRHRSTRLSGAVLVLPMWWLAQTLVDGVLYGSGLLR